MSWEHANKAHSHTDLHTPFHRPISPTTTITAPVHRRRRSCNNLHGSNTRRKGWRWWCRRWRRERERSRGQNRDTSRSWWCIRVPCWVAILLSEVFNGVEVNEAGLGCTADECGGKVWAFGLRGQGSKRVSTPECVMAVKGAYLEQ